MTQHAYYNLAQAQPAFYLPPDLAAKNEALFFLEALLKNLPVAKKLETYISLTEQRHSTKNPHYDEFLLNVMNFLWCDLSDNQHTWLNNL